MNKDKSNLALARQARLRHIQKNWKFSPMPYSYPLTMVFVGLRMAGFIEWSWLWVLFPVWFTSFAYTIFIILWAMYGPEKRSNKELLTLAISNLKAKMEEDGLL
jgi:hypothetical protein